MNKKPVVVTTEFKGVFFGYVLDDSKAPASFELERARMCVYWSTDTRGVVGLAASGPSTNCKVTHATPKITLYKITSVQECSPEAAEKWEAAPWK